MSILVKHNVFVDQKIFQKIALKKIKPSQRQPGKQDAANRKEEG
jgi:hypothetical protein